jgi:hypothetical protein
MQVARGGSEREERREEKPYSAKKICGWFNAFAADPGGG